MKFSDMLKKKKNSAEETQNPDIQEQQEILEEIQFVNDALQNHKNDMEEGLEDEKEISPSQEEKLKAEVEEWNNKYLRLYAEFDNYKRRTVKERMELLQTAGKDVIVELLSVLDDFERAGKAMETAKDIEAVKEGMTLVQNKLKNILTQKGLKEMESKGKTFDADIHEGITSIPAPSDDMKGKIIDELEKGYFLNDKVIRFAKVVIGA
ncbi:nucleotide exchange factor GrpE [Daejeonella oryzae]|uniref:nucleotide exchange factor GrpE n=1 Tax=Daejeonella oryzae TaxID=1122943 RepID=UPI0003FE7FD3|nr:nucleotide exchange factor GrpE [Daejeonella oryzae]